MIGVRRPTDDELGLHASDAAADAHVLDTGLASLAERWSYRSVAGA